MRDEKGRFIKGNTVRKTSINKHCEICGIQMTVQPHRFLSGRGKFCSKKCSNLGKYTEDVRKKMSLAKKGKPAPHKSGERCSFWKGGVTPINRYIRTSLEYKLWRESVFKRDNWTCIWCGIVGRRLQADHIKPFSLYPELRFAIDNGRTLCVDCHKKTDTYGGKINKKTK